MATVFRCVVAACLAGLPSLQTAGDLPAEAPPVESEFASSSLKRIEYFELSTTGTGDVTDTLGLVEWREREVAGGAVLERDVFFAGGNLTVRHVERLTADTTRLVWREAAPGVGRSQIVEPEEDQLVIVDWLRSGVERTDLSAAGQTHFPLALLESLRDQKTLPPNVSRYWPLTRAVEELRIEECHLGGGAGLRRRLVEFMRADGSLAGRYLFDGDSLEAFQWQEGELWARRVTPERHRLVRYRLANRKPVEAAADSR